MFEEQDKNSGRNNNFYVRKLDAKSNPKTTIQKIEMFPGRKTKTQTKHPPVGRAEERRPKICVVQREATIYDMNNLKKSHVANQEAARQKTCKQRA